MALKDAVRDVEGTTLGRVLTGGGSIVGHVEQSDPEGVVRKVFDIVNGFVCTNSAGDRRIVGSVGFSKGEPVLYMDGEVAKGYRPVIYNQS